MVGPTLRDGHFIYGDLTGVADLPVGWTFEAEAGAFRLKRRDDQALFGYGVGQQSWKQFLFPPHHLLWRAARRGDDFQMIPPAEAVPRYAFIGVRSCDLHAMAVQDRVFLQGRHVDPVYQARREQAFILAVNCGGQGCGTCFCVSMGTGPRATFGFDLALTEVLPEGKHYFLVEVGTDRGAGVLQAVPQRAAGAAEIAAAASVVAATAANMGRELDTQGIKELLYRSYEHPRWDEVAARCLNCGNCTWVCPTCFCHTIEDVTDLTGAGGGKVAAAGRLFHRGLFLHSRRQHPLLAPVPLPPVADPQTGHLDRPVRLLRLRRLRPLYHLVSGGYRYYRRDPGHPGN